MMQFRLLMAASLGVISLASAPAQAAIQFFTSAASFDAATNAAVTDDFNELSMTFYGPLNRTEGPFGYRVSATNGIYPGFAGSIFMSTSTSTDTMVFNNFSGGANAIAGLVFGSDVNGNLASVPSITVKVSAGSLTRTEIFSNPTISSFFGFVASAPITELTFSAQQPAPLFRWPSVDNLVLAQAVPEPHSWALLIAGFGLVGAMARRRRAALA
ncbi:MAG: PEPxxWA-CTERM sorting domain-containing protein [Alphaproteobacteria bacterium]|nr:PEPxxWA-CTERM sorting domain-containing protein [Alphaproteobacteria bacterium]